MGGFFFLAWQGVFWGVQAAMGAEVELGQVVVTATRTEIEISDVPQSISVITKEEIMNYARPDHSRGHPEGGWRVDNQQWTHRFAYLCQYSRFGSGAGVDHD